MRHAKFILFAALLALASCATQAATNPLVQASPHFTVAGSHDSVATGWITQGVPATAAYRYRGNGTVTLSPHAPYLYFDGDIEFTVEPVNIQSVQRAQYDVTAGLVVIRRNGQPSSFNSPGTIGSMRAAEQPSFQP